MEARSEIIKKLKKETLSLQGYKHTKEEIHKYTGLEFMEHAFPCNTFPTGAIHEFVSTRPGEAASTNGFITAVISQLQESTCLWISTQRTLFPAALKTFNIQPERVLFIDLKKQKDVLWAMEEALKCEELAAVVGELNELDFTESRRLQLITERSKVTAFIHRYRPGKINNPVASVARWAIKPLPSIKTDDMPGVGFPQWDVQLLKVRNGKTGKWKIGWLDGRFTEAEFSSGFHDKSHKTGSYG